MTLVIAHRGFSAKYPENTILAFKKAIEIGCDGVEFDVQATKDRVLVVFHDSDLKRLSGKKLKISELTYSELCEFKVGTESIPKLIEVLNTVKNMNIINIEVKIKGYEEEIFGEVLIAGVENNSIISSSQSAVLKRFRQICQDIKLAYVMDNRPDRLREWRKLNKEIKLFSVHPFHQRPIFTQRLFNKLKEHDVKSMPWFLINTEQEIKMKKLIKMGVDGIITDHPDKLIRIMVNNR